MECLQGPDRGDGHGPVPVAAVSGTTGRGHALMKMISREMATLTPRGTSTTDAHRRADGIQRGPSGHNAGAGIAGGDQVPPIAVSLVNQR
jgi:hypothetical protein